MGKRLAWSGLLLTAVYIVFWMWILKGRAEDLDKLKLNELGDFLAGTFGPLAILWLILGFFQQGIELRQNSEALHLQAEELRNSVEQQKAMVDVAREEHQATMDSLRLERERLEHEREQQRLLNQPRLSLIYGGGTFGSSSTVNFLLHNSGMDASELTITTRDDQIRIDKGSAPYLARGQSFTFKVGFGALPEGHPLHIDVSYCDRLGHHERVSFVGRWDREEGHPKPTVHIVKGEHNRSG